jgi:hypothetical protein
MIGVKNLQWKSKKTTLNRRWFAKFSILILNFTSTKKNFRFTTFHDVLSDVYDVHSPKIIHLNHVGTWKFLIGTGMFLNTKFLDYYFFFSKLREEMFSVNIKNSRPSNNILQHHFQNFPDERYFWFEIPEI